MKQTPKNRSDSRLSNLVFEGGRQRQQRTDDIPHAEALAAVRKKYNDNLWEQMKCDYAQYRVRNKTSLVDFATGWYAGRLSAIFAFNGHINDDTAP